MAKLKFKNLIIGLAVATVLIGAAILLKSNPGSAQFIWQLSNGGKWLLPLVAITALVDSINPCAFSVLLLTIAFLFSMGKMQSGVLKIGGMYIFGVFLVYILIGLGLLGTLHLFNTPHFMGKVGAVLLIILGLINLTSQAFPNFPIKLKIPKFSHQKIARLMEVGTLPAAFALGVLVGLCEFPCTGGPYLMILGLLHDKATYLKGMGYLAIYNLIFILPLVVILISASDKSLLDKIQDWKNRETKKMKFWSGILMIVLGAIIYWL